MKDLERDILAEKPHLRTLAYRTPQGYFEAFRSEMKTPSCSRPGPAARLAPYLAMAAVFIFLVTAGTFFLRQTTPTEELTQEDFIIFSSNISRIAYYSEMEQIAEADIAEDDIIEYLIYSGISAEEIELSK